MSTELTTTIAIPSGVRLRVEGSTLRVEGPLGKVARPFPASALGLSVSSGKAVLTLRLPERRRSRALFFTWVAHLRNMVAGVSRGIEAKAKVVAAHFPMKVSVKDNLVMIENFLGEKYPRKSPLRGATRAEVAGDELHFQGIDIEDVGQSVANLEKATHIRNYDPRVFQDGIYVTSKARVKEAA